MLKNSLWLTVPCALLLAGCSQPYAYNQANTGNRYDGQGQLIGKPHQGRNAALGAAAGAALGQLWGKDTEATVTGAVVGGIIGSQVNTPN